MSKKSIIYALAALICVSVFAPIVWAEETKEPVTLTVLNYFDLTAPNASREITEVWEEFEKRNPHITVIREDLFNEPFHHKTEAYAAAGNLPDVMFM